MASVTKVSSTLEPCAGSRPAACKPEWNQHARRGGDHQIQQHRAGHHEAEAELRVDDDREQADDQSPARSR